MAISSFSAARTVCAQGNWGVTNLQLQKILYILQMVHMGRYGGEPLFDDFFEAWDYGPVIPNVYHKAKIFGNGAVEDIFFTAPIIVGGDDAKFIKEGCDHLLTKRAAELVAITHWKDGAWAKNYIKGVRNVVIPNNDIVAEYKARFDGRG